MASSAILQISDGAQLKPISANKLRIAKSSNKINMHMMTQGAQIDKREKENPPNRSVIGKANMNRSRRWCQENEKAHNSKGQKADMCEQ